MTEQNVEVVRQAYDALSRKDVSSALSRAAEDFELDWSNSRGPDRGVYIGQDQVRQFLSDFLDVVDSVHWTIEEVIVVDRSRLITTTRFQMRGRDSGVEVDAIGATLWTFADGMSRSAKLYQSKAEALEAAGLSE